MKTIVKEVDFKILNNLWMLTLYRALTSSPLLDENLIDFWLQKAIFSEEMKRRPAIGPAVVDK